MSGALYPTLPGLAYSFIRTPVWKTQVKAAASGRETRIAFMSAPIWRYTLTYEVLRSATALHELQTLANFFNAVQGEFDWFNFNDPDDNAVTDMPFGTGAGAVLAFQLTRTLVTSGFAEPIQSLNGAPTIKVAGVTKTAGVDYTISSTGLVTFTVAPVGALTWTGAYYWPARFYADSIDFEKFMLDRWSAKKVQFQTVRL